MSLFQPFFSIILQSPVQIPVIKLLSLIIEPHFSWLPHITCKNIRAKCLQNLNNILEFLSHPTKGCNRSTLLHLYISLTRSIIDYGVPVYSLINQSYLTLLDSVQNTRLRLAFGAFWSSPALSLCAEAGMPPLSFTRYTLSTMAHNLSLPMYKCIFEPDSISISNSKPHHHIEIKLESSGTEPYPTTFYQPLFLISPSGYKYPPNTTLTSQNFQNLLPPGNLPVPSLRNHQPIHKPCSMLHGWMETRNKNKLCVLHIHSNRSCPSL